MIRWTSFGRPCRCTSPSTRWTTRNGSPHCTRRSTPASGTGMAASSRWPPDGWRSPIGPSATSTPCAASTWLCDRRLARNLGRRAADRCCSGTLEGDFDLAAERNMTTPRGRPARRRGAPLLGRRRHPGRVLAVPADLEAPRAVRIGLVVHGRQRPGDARVQPSPGRAPRRSAGAGRGGQLGRVRPPSRDVRVFSLRSGARSPPVSRTDGRRPRSWSSSNRSPATSPTRPDSCGLRSIRCGRSWPRARRRRPRRRHRLRGRAGQPATRHPAVPRTASCSCSPQPERRAGRTPSRSTVWSPRPSRSPTAPGHRSSVPTRPTLSACCQ